MILAAAVILGLLVSLVRFRGGAFGRIAALPLRSAWLAVLAVVLQLPLLRSPAGPPRELGLQQALFLGSHLLLLAFVWYNRQLTGVLIVGVGLLCNLLVIALNGGFMPITPETLARINPGTLVGAWPEGIHYGYSKDVIRTREATRLWALSDVLVLAPPFPRPTAFSIGDLVIATGIVGLMQGSDDQSAPGAERVKVSKQLLSATRDAGTDGKADRSASIGARSINAIMDIEQEGRKCSTKD